MPAEPTKVVIRIIFDKKSKAFQFEGPMKDPILCLGMIETAKARLISQMTLEDVEAMEAKKRIQVVPAGSLPKN